jgi:adenosylhomocysteine nucleosidase
VDTDADDRYGRAVRVVVLISADAEWRAVAARLEAAVRGTTPWGATLETEIAGEPVLFVHGGWGKIAAAASAQYAIDRWQPELLVNLGTCGGFAGAVSRFDVVVAARTVVHDIVERMGDAVEAIAAYETVSDLEWLGGDMPTPALPATLVSADQDVDTAAVDELRRRYGAVAGDWESGAIAHVARRNRTRCLVLRGVSDLVGEAYGRSEVFVEGAQRVMDILLEALPAWIARSRQAAAAGAGASLDA